MANPRFRTRLVKEMNYSRASKIALLCATAVAVPAACLAIGVAPATAATAATVGMDSQATQPPGDAGTDWGPGFLVTNALPSTCTVTARDHVHGGGEIVCTDVGRNALGNQIAILASGPKIHGIKVENLDQVHTITAGFGYDQPRIAPGESKTFHQPAIGVNSELAGKDYRVSKVVITLVGS